jgi:probable rRNA maturation factor
MALRVRVSLPGVPAARAAAGAHRPATIPQLRTLVGTAARAALRDQDVPRAELSITLVDDAQIAELNGRYLGREHPTDVLAFALHAEGEAPIGDIYIGYEQALRQAGDLGVDPLEELARLVVHGTLHVLGHDHPEEAGRLDSPMWQAQERIIRTVRSS